MNKIIVILFAFLLIQSCREDESMLKGDFNFEEEIINLAEAPFYNEVCGSSFTLDAGVGNASYLWSTGDTTKTIQLYAFDSSFGGLYKVQITANNSTWADSVFITLAVASYIVPNAFSPNGDGVNDIFQIYGSCLAQTYLKILNNFNSKVLFESWDIANGWDGTYNGSPMPADEYPYEVEIVTLDGQLVTSHGMIKLVR